MKISEVTIKKIIFVVSIIVFLISLYTTIFLPRGFIIVRELGEGGIWYDNLGRVQDPEYKETFDIQVMNKKEFARFAWATLFIIASSIQILVSITSGDRRY